MKKKQTIILIVLATALIITAFGTVSNIFIRNQLAGNLLEEYQQQEHLIANEVAKSLKDNIDGVREKLELIAAQPEVQTGDRATCTKKLEQAFTILDSKVGNLGRVGPDGLFTCSINEKLVGVRAAQLGAYIPQIFNDPDHKPVLSRAFVPPGADSYIAAIHVPVLDANKKFLGTLGGAVYFNEIQTKFLKDITLASHGFVALLDDNGDILYHPESSLIGKNYASPDVKRLYGNSTAFTTAMQRAQQGETGGVRYTFNGEERLAVYRPASILPGHHWSVFVAVPTKDAAAELSRVGVDTAFIGFTVVLSIAVAVIAGMMMINLVRSYELQQTKDEFVNLASHQLRTPATAVMDYLDLVLDGNAGKITPKQRELLQVAHDSNQREIGIIKDMLNVAKLDAGHIRLVKKPQDIVSLIQDILTEQKTIIAQRQQVVRVTPAEGGIVAAIDPTYGRMVLDNLISNASKYTHEKGTIEIHVSSKGNRVVIAIKDNGVGIDKKDMAKLFGKMNRIKNELSDVVGGNGLGLYLVKNLIELHGGSITVRSQVNQGTEFIVTIPRGHVG